MHLQVFGKLILVVNRHGLLASLSVFLTRPFRQIRPVWHSRVTALSGWTAVTSRCGARRANSHWLISRWKKDSVAWLVGMPLVVIFSRLLDPGSACGMPLHGG